MSDIFGFVLWSTGICRKKAKTSRNALRQLCSVMAGRKDCLPNLYPGTVKVKILLMYFAA